MVRVVVERHDGEGAATIRRASRILTTGNYSQPRRDERSFARV